MDKGQTSGAIQGIKIVVVRDKKTNLFLSTQLEYDETINILKECLKLMEMEASQKSSTS